MTFPVVRCPFILCKSTVSLIIEQATPGDDESTVQRVQMHDLQPDTWYGRCPASLTLYPTSAEDLAAFNSALFRHRNMREDRDRAAAEGEARPPEPTSPSAPRAPSTWFRPNPNPGLPATGPRGFRRMFLPNNQPRREGAMASVADVRAAIGQACAALDAGREFARLATGKASEGEAILRWVREQGTVDPIGVPNVSAAVEHLVNGRSQLAEGIEAARTYAGSM